MDEKLELIREKISSADSILITSHKRPDGDAVGSVIGLGLALLDSGKNVEIVMVDGIPKNFSHLVGSEKISKKINHDFDISIILDCSELKRIGFDFEDNFFPTINIDHHITNDNFAEINIVEVSSPATTEILSDLIPKIGLDITTPVADALLTGLITDTLGFRTCNMHAKTLRIAASLMEKGSDLPTLYQHALLNRTFKAAQYWGAGLSTLNLENGVLWATLSLEDRKRIGYPGRDDADLINILSSIDEIDVAIIFVEQQKDAVKVSWRAKKGIDVSKIASIFGGGGHKPAAGAEIKGELEFVKSEVLTATQNYLRKD